jgi:glycosyltransferase involved in cell wall biosynthesis
MKAALFSIVVPTFNAVGSLARALRSLQKQSYKNLEVLLIDGGSTDDTVAIAETFRETVTVLVSEPDRGQAHALNKGLQRARGEYVGWLCADDELLPDALLHAANHFDAAPDLDMLSGACERRYEDGSVQIVIPPSDAFEIIGAQYRIEQPSTFWRNRIESRDVTLDESFHFAFDWDFFAEQTKRARRTLVLPDVMSTYHFSATNKTSNGGRRLVNEMFRIVQKHGPLDGRLAKIFSLLYRRFDLAGCYDQPPTCTPDVGRRFGRILNQLEAKYGTKWIHMYNWNFASKQERQLLWYK